MRYVLDASVAVAAARPSELTHAAALRRLERVLRGDDEIVVPVIFQIEVAAALTRVGIPAVEVTSYVEKLLAVAAVVTLGPVRARQIQSVAVLTRLRGADATYAWLAGREGVPLVTSDDEVLQRAAPICVPERP